MQPIVEGVFRRTPQSVTITRRRVKLVPCDLEWPKQFAALRATLEEIFPPPTYVIEHIGSTAIGGIDAKPVIDIMLGAPTLEEIESGIEHLAAIGFQYVDAFNALMPQRRYFTYPATRPHIAHLHAVVNDKLFWRDHVLFRDTLRKSAALAQEYEALKRALAIEFSYDPETYTDAKALFIQSVLNRARISPPQ